MKKLILSTFLLSTVIAFAQESKLSVSGSVDTYYSTNISNSELGTVGILSDVAANGFGLGMANIVFGYESGKTGVVADLTYGPRGNAANAYNGAINQLYAYYQASDKLKFTLGQFNTFYGYEVISPAANFNYSVSYLFNAGPFSHTGFKLDYAVSDDLSYMLAITNPHGITTGSNTTSDDYQLGAQVGYKDQYFNLAYGADGFGYTDVLYLDYTGGFDFSDSFYVGINAAYANSEDADSGYQGVALYLENTISETFALGLRPEFFQTTGTSKADTYALTLAGSHTLSESLKLITEVRYDTSDNIIIGTTENKGTGLTIAAVYSF